MLLPYVLFVFLYVGSNLLIYEFENWITGVCFSLLFPCVILHTMSSGNSLQLLCIFLFGMLCLSAISMMVCENSVGSVYIGGYGGLSESRLCVFRELCSVSFLVVGECQSVLL